MSPLHPGQLAEQLAPYGPRARAVVAAALEGDSRLIALRQTTAKLLGVASEQLGAIRLCHSEKLGGPHVEVMLGLTGARIELTLRRGDAPGPAMIALPSFSVAYRRADRPAGLPGAIQSLPPQASREIGLVEARLRVEGGSRAAPIVQGLFAAADAQRRREGASRLAPADTPADLGPDGDALRRLRAEFQRHFGSALPVHRTHGDGGPISFEFPAQALPDTNSFFRLPERIRDDPAAAAYLARLGYACDAAGDVRTVPTPSSYLGARARLGLTSFGFLPTVVSVPTTALFTARWLRDSTVGVLPVNLGSRWFYLRLRPFQSRLALRSARVRKEWEGHFTTLGHDASVHLLSTHLVPRPLLFRLGDRVRAAMGGPISRVAPPRPLVLFYDRDLFLHCRELWKRLDALEDFTAALVEEQSLRALCDLLEQRISEARAPR